MKEIIDRLKKLADNIQLAKHGKRGKEIHINSYTVIDEYQEWRTRSEDLFEEYFDESNSQFKKFKEVPNGGNGYVLMHYFDQQYPIFKVLISKIENGEVGKKDNIKMNKKDRDQKQENKIFISHSSNDEEIVNAFVDIILLGSLSVRIDQIFCTSTDGTKIRSGDYWRDSIKDNLINAQINILIITPNYKESEVCLNEMGAAWITNAKVLPVIVDPIEYETVGVIQQPKQIEKLLKEDSLDRIRDLIQTELNIPDELIKSDRWSSKKREFLSRVKKHLEKNPFQTPLDRNVFNKLQTENKELNKTIDDLTEEKGALEKLIKDLEQSKDREEVNKIKKQHFPDSDYHEFLELAKEAKYQLKLFSPIVRGIIFKDFTGKEIGINWHEYQDDIDLAIAEDYIREDLTVNWETTKEMDKISEILRKINTLLLKDLDDSFIHAYKDDFDAPMSIDNKSFWEEVFDLPIRI